MYFFQRSSTHPQIVQMGSQPLPQLHFVLIPLMGQGHLIPMADIAKLLAQRGVIVTVITTPLNALRIQPITDRAASSGLPIRLLQLPFPSLEAGLPEGTETLDTVPSLHSFKNFFVAISMLQQPLVQLFEQFNPRPSCMISDKYLAFTANIAHKFGIPRIVFDGTSCFNILCNHNLHISRVFEGKSEFDPFVVPGLPDRIEFTWAQLPSPFNPGSLVSSDMKDNRIKIREGELAAYGVVVNSFEELEPGYVEGHRKMVGDKVWCIGPVSLCNKEALDMAQRGNKASIDENQCLKWLNSWNPGTVVYACLGTLTRLTTPQLAELGLGLEASKMPFIWVIRGGERKEEIEKWLLEDGFEERTKDRGLLVRGWAPQVLILSHRAIGGFLTHCGWNSTLEGVCAGLPMVTWPIFSEQFFNEKLIVQVLGIGVGVGAKVVVHLCEEEKFGVLVKREDVKKAVEEVMDEGREGEERRKRARELQGKAKKAMDRGGSSYTNLTLLVEDIMQLAEENQAKA